MKGKRKNMHRKKIIMDVDTGSDDALAIMCAVLCPDEFDIIGICSVNGNRPVENTTENTLRVLKLLGATDIPVLKGASSPLVADLYPERALRCQASETEDPEGNTIAYHSEYLPLPPSGMEPAENTPAAVWMVNTLLSSDEKVTLILTGPLTDLALAYRLAPSIIEHISEIVIMGGGHDQRNTTGAAEFNIFADPEAAAIVFSIGVYVPITLMTLDATHMAYLDEDDVKRLRSAHDPICDFAAEEVEERIKAYDTLQPLAVPGIAPIHDALCVLYLIDPRVITKKEFLHVEIVCGGNANGMTLIDTRRSCPDPKNVNVCFATDTSLFKELLCTTLEKSTVI